MNDTSAEKKLKPHGPGRLSLLRKGSVDAVKTTGNIVTTYASPDIKKIRKVSEFDRFGGIYNCSSPKSNRRKEFDEGSSYNSDFSPKSIVNREPIELKSRFFPVPTEREDQEESSLDFSVIRHMNNQPKEVVGVFEKDWVQVRKMMSRKDRGALNFLTSVDIDQDSALNTDRQRDKQLTETQLKRLIGEADNRRQVPVPGHEMTKDFEAFDFSPCERQKAAECADISVSDLDTPHQCRRYVISPKHVGFRGFIQSTQPHFESAYISQSLAEQRKLNLNDGDSLPKKLTVPYFGSSSLHDVTRESGLGDLFIPEDNVVLLSSKISNYHSNAVKSMESIHRFNSQHQFFARNLVTNHNSRAEWVAEDLQSHSFSFSSPPLQKIQ